MTLTFWTPQQEYAEDAQATLQGRLDAETKTHLRNVIMIRIMCIKIVIIWWVFHASKT